MTIQSKDYYKLILWEIAVRICCNDKTDMKTKKLQVSAIVQIRSRLDNYSERGIVPFLINEIAKKKGEMVINATTKSELAKILALKCPHYDGNTFVPDKYMIPEEEIIMWSETSFIAPLNGAAQKRYQELFSKLFPKQAKDIFG